MADPKQQIHAELMAMRAAGADNKDIIQAACTKLFAAGTTPNQVNVLEVIRTEGSSPSVVTIRKGLEAFWASIRAKVGDLPDLLAEGVPEPILDVLKAVAPQLALAADKVGKAWYEESVATLEARAQAADDAANGYAQAAKDAQALVDSVNIELAHARERVDELGDEVASRAAENSRQADMLSQAHEKAHRDNARIEKLEADFYELRKGAAEAKDAHNQALKALAAAKESVASLLAQTEGAEKARAALEKAHDKALDEREAAQAKLIADMNKRSDYQVSQLGLELSASRAATEKAESAKQAALVKAGELGGEIKAQAAEIDRLKNELRTAQDEAVSERVIRVNSYAAAERVIEWIRAPKRKPANSAFSAGPERQVAYAVEDVLAGIGMKGGGDDGQK